MTRTDPVVFVRAYLDKFDCENWDGQGIKAATVLSAEWTRGVVQGAETDIARALVRLANGDEEELECWGRQPPHVSAGHIFTSIVRRLRADPESFWYRPEDVA